MAYSNNPKARPLDVSGIVFAILMSGMMSIFFAGLFGFLAHGPTSEWLSAWIEGVIIAWPLGGVLAAVSARHLRRISDRMAGRSS